MKDQKIYQMEKYSQDLKEQLSDIQGRSQQAVENEREQFKAERVLLNDKSDDLLSQLKAREREVTSLQT